MIFFLKAPWAPILLTLKWNRAPIVREYLAKNFRVIFCHFCLNDRDLFLKLPWAPIYTNFEGEARDENTQELG